MKIQEGIEALKKNRSLIESVSSLILFQILNIAVPLLTYPYLIRVLGAEKYGLVIFAQSVVNYLLILVSFGFNISATKDVSINRDSREQLGKIFSSVSAIKSVFLTVAILILSVVIHFVPNGKEYQTLFYLSLWICVYDLIFPVWYFQGIEKMKYITYMSTIYQTIYVVLIFMFVNDVGDYLLIPIINGIGALIAGVSSLYVIVKYHGLKLGIPKIETMTKSFKDAIPFFLSNVSTRIYLGSNKVIIGSFLGMQDLAYYDLAEKLTSVLKVPQTILGQSIFPRVSKEKSKIFIRKAFLLSLSFNTLIVATFMLLSESIIKFLGGNEMIPSITIASILVLSVPIIGMSNIFGVQMLVPFGKARLFSRIIVSTAFIYIMLVIIVSLYWSLNAISLSVVTVITESAVAAILFYFCKKYRLLTW